MAQPATVLVLAEVDDADRAALVEACSEAGFSPTVEPSAEVATGKLGQKRFDALVVHMGTPGAALACMRARGKLLRIRIPVIALADTEDDAAFARAYRAGADEVLVLGRSKQLTERLLALPKPSIPQPGNSRGDAVVADADRTRAEVLERVLRDAGFRVEVVGDAFAARLQAGRPSLKVAVVDASLDDVPPLIAQARAKGARCAWVVRTRPEVLTEIRQKLASLDRVAVVSAYGPPDDVLFETNRMLEPRPSDGRADPRLLHGTIVRLKWRGGAEGIGYTYNVSPLGLFIRTVLPPLGEILEMEVLPPGVETRIRLEGKVVWRREFGTTRKEPVPAGFGVQITGGDIETWAEACPRAPSIRRPMADESRPPAARLQIALPKKTPSEPSSAAPTSAAIGSIVAPGDVDIQPREPQSSVEEMLASVLSETIPGDDSGAAPLSIDGGNVVELKDGEEAPPDAAAAPRPPSDRPPSDRAPEIAEDQRVTTVPDGAASAVTAEPDITPASLGFMDMEDVESVAGGVSDQHQARLEETFSSIGSSDTIPALSLASAALEAKAETEAVPEKKPLSSEETLPPARLRAVSSVPPSANGARDSELRVPKSGSSPLVWGLLVLGIGGGALYFATQGRAPGGSAPHAVALPVAPSQAKPEAPAAIAETSSAAVPAPTEEPVPSVKSAEPSPAVETAAPAPSPAPSVSVAPSSAPGDDAAALGSLPKGQGLLYVASPLSTNVYVYGILAGTTNTRITTKCGPRFLRLGTAPGRWQSEGFVQIVKCGVLTRVDVPQ